MVRIITVITGLTAMLVSTAVCARYIMTWQPPFDTYQQALRHDAQHVRQLLIQHASDFESDALRHSQYHLILSHVYLSLNQHSNARKHAIEASEAVTAEQQPWLYHKARLNEALSLLTLRETPEGVGQSPMVQVNAAMVWAELTEHSELLAYSLFVRAELFSDRDETQNALNDYLRAYALLDSTDTRHQAGQIAMRIATLYESRGDDVQSIPFFEHALRMFRQQKNWREVGLALYGMGRANEHLGLIGQGRQQLLESAQLNRDIQDNLGLAYSLKALGNLELTQREWRRANAYLTEALMLFSTEGNRPMLHETSVSLARLKIALGDLDSANGHLVTARETLDEKGEGIYSVMLNEVSAAFMAANNQYEQAYKKLADTIRQKNKLMNQQSAEQIHDLRARYELEAKARENALLEQQNVRKRADLLSYQIKNLQLILLFSSLLIICGLLILLVYRTRAHKTRFEQLANTDSLTGIANRRAIMEKLKQQVDLADRHDIPLAIAIADLDHFKRINDQFGHPVGDRVLAEFGALCRATFRHTDLVGRIGGEEFLLALPHTHLDDAKKALKSLSLKVKALSDKIDIEDLSLSISFGLCPFSAGLSVSEILSKADQALYKAKQNGRDRLEVYQSE